RVDVVGVAARSFHRVNDLGGVEREVESGDVSLGKSGREISQLSVGSRGRKDVDAAARYIAEVVDDLVRPAGDVDVDGAVAGDGRVHPFGEDERRDAGAARASDGRAVRAAANHRGSESSAHGDQEVDSA